MFPLSKLNQYLRSADRPTATLMIGVPGSGKSTWIRQNMDLQLVIISSDDILEILAAESGISYHQSFGNNQRFAEQLMYSNLDHAVSANQSMVIDRTNLSMTARAKILAHVPPTYLRYAAIFSVAKAELDRRLAQREAETGKWIPPTAVTQMLASYEAPKAAEFDEVFA